MIKIVSFKICPFVQRVTGLLEAKNIPYDIEYIDLKNKPQWFLDVSPTGQVPVLIAENGEALFESDAIMEYLDEIYAPLVLELTPEQKAKDRAWSYQASKHYLAQCSTMRSPDADTLSERLETLNKAFERVEKQIGVGPFFNGGTLGNVDIAWLPLLHRAAIISKHRDFDFLANYPKVKQWQSNILSTEFAEKSVADDFEKAFTDFYLSDSTYLGVGEIRSDIAENNKLKPRTCC
ncbi:glutathione S-transferase family protein [Kiloniella sp.]|uniref:glutathione S-transferase family protein n=1 Tax=Kiloniella sp. TaxID=1938587 RepID=UPI003A92D25C